jgi:hypothetical protein
MRNAEKCGKIFNWQRLNGTRRDLKVEQRENCTGRKGEKTVPNRENN